MADYSKVYSFSKLDTFDKCKQQYSFNYLDPDISPIRKQFFKPRDYTTKGQAVHGAITLFYYYPNKKRTFSNLKKCLKKAWYSEKDASKPPPLGEVGGFKDLLHERKSYKESLILLRNFFNLESQNPNLFYVPVRNIRESFEDYEKMIQPIGGKYLISGKFDRIDETEGGGLKVIDFKTGKSKSSPFQLEVYKLLAEMNFGRKVEQASFYYLFNKKIKDVNIKGIKSKDIRNKIMEKIKEINKTKEFPAKPGRFCSHCDFREICYAFGGSKEKFLKLF
ncbi:MAG: hypothetical protein A2365_02955 [Candidatus Nealsonbacteria bacterium RIFOXYB1_FULL_40_15]|uniref:PD-(D/E)XK endonuclease-like domain-containing protein n=2 Tax=Candidatus Nealsoniibacteriota TaxID=1817911 RepID=A0A1G2ERU2_9BACT|nr:MAG: hypothetical protein A2365_02955 [Candidatus Nealsonbacteria bacterium RIFOXYB1_FULL_40_15]OGZ28457.1 MAG: hypothetical protein A2427_02580 [Candidatus Nealsonbacteria bacterium RIFOXYC1_FULL_40_7]OGZ29868.1 MAG: hypothetical protein A2562_01990 [Candidatus Nealsonbacteria bacterium RIFOXYD1_FULL_39_11]